MLLRALAAVLLVLGVVGCGTDEGEGDEGDAMSDDAPPSEAPDTTAADTTTTADGLTADEIPVAHTPPGGYGAAVPAPVLAGCTEPLVEGAPDLRGWWRVVEVEVDGAIDPSHRALGHVQRVEQCGDRLVVTAGGIVHDMRCDGTEANGVHDVAEMDKTTPITVVATYEDSVHVLRPVGLPVEVKRWRDGDDLVWAYLGFTARLAYVSPPEADPPEADPPATDPPTAPPPTDAAGAAPEEA